MKKHKLVGWNPAELLAVIAVLSLLVAILWPELVAAGSAARRGACVSHLRQIGRAYAMYRDVHGRYPEVVRLAESPYLQDRRVFFCPEDEQVTRTDAAASYRFRRRVPPDFAFLGATARVPPGTVLAACEHHVGRRNGARKGRGTDASLPRYPYHLVLRAGGSVDAVDLRRLRTFALPGKPATFMHAYPGEPGYAAAEQSAYQKPLPAHRRARGSATPFRSGKCLTTESG